MQTLAYRAPEVTLGMPYAPAIDMWSLGCILFYLITGELLFPALDELHLFELYLRTLGMIPDTLL